MAVAAGNAIVEAIALKGMCSSDPTIRGALLSRLNRTYFRTEAGREVYDVILAHVQRKGESPRLKWLRQSNKLSDKAFALMSNSRAKKPEDFKDASSAIEVLSDLRKRYISHEAAHKFVSQLLEENSGKYDVSDMITELQGKLVEAQTGRDFEDSTYHFGSRKDKEQDKAKKLIRKVLDQEDKTQLIPTGYKAWDKRNGGWQRGSLIMLAGSTGAGKSHNAIQLAKNQADAGYKSLVVPLEMGEEAVTTRFLANISGVDSLKITKKELSPGEIKHIKKSYTEFQEKTSRKRGRLTIFKPKTDISLEELFAAIHGYNADIIYIDYVGLLKEADGDDQWRKLGQIARAAAIYADVHNKIVVLLAQVSDEGKLKYSQTMREHAPVMWSFVATKETRDQGILRFEVPKARNQDSAPFVMQVAYALSRITDIEEASADSNRGGGKKGNELHGPSSSGGKKGAKGGATGKKTKYIEDSDDDVELDGEPDDDLSE